MYKYIVWTRCSENPNIRLTKQFKAVMTSFEKELTSERIKRGILAKKALKRRKISEIIEL